MEKTSWRKRIPLVKFVAGYRKGHLYLIFTTVIDVYFAYGSCFSSACRSMYDLLETLLKRLDCPLQSDLWEFPNTSLCSALKFWRFLHHLTAKWRFLRMIGINLLNERIPASLWPYRVEAGVGKGGRWRPSKEGYTGCCVGIALHS